ncbi:MAG: hypothetical protein NTZ05_04430 [Chloroflexi bacterium]|nr:hypothetical protein [Chloroflexota bacterium]
MRALVNERVAALGPAAAEMLAQASVLGQTFSFAVLLRMSEMDEDALLTEIERAVSARLLADASTAADERFRFLAGGPGAGSALREHLTSAATALALAGGAGVGSARRGTARAAR